MISPVLAVGELHGVFKWLHELLASHPDVYVPTRRKEVRYFDRYPERDLQWYAKFFPSDGDAGQYRAIGEISPGYLYCPGCPEKIASVPSITNLILMLRNPGDRLYSDYGERIRSRNFSGPFEDFLSLESRIKLGFYSPKIKNYLRYFMRDQILVLIFERAVTDVPKTKETLARFLGVAVERFPPAAGTRKVNRSYIPKPRPAPHALVKFVYGKFYDWDLEPLASLITRVGELFGEAGSLPLMKEETRQHLKEIYEDEIRELASLLQIDLECWE